MIVPSDVNVAVVSQDGTHGVLEVIPLQTGFGHTLGNSLRRVLLSQIKGAAVAQVKINGVSHKFSAKAGLEEDILELTLNLKKIRVRLFGDDPVVLQLRKSGSGKVLAGDIQTSGLCEIINKDLVIAHLSGKNSEIDLELIVEPGYGYVACDDRQIDKIGVIALDSLYSPVLHVSYKVESARVGQQTNLDRLILEVTTDGTISPEEAFVQASAILEAYYTRLKMGKEANVFPEQPKEEVVTEEALSSKEREIPVDDLNLPIRIINSLKKGGIMSLGDLVDTPESELRKIRNVGGKSLDKIKKALESEGLT